METTETKKISIRLLKILENSFYIDLSPLRTLDEIKPDSIKFELGFKLDINEDNDYLDLFLNIQYLFQDKNTKILEAETINSFEIEDLKNQIERKGEQFTDKSGFLPTILGVGLGTIRGVIVAKTAGTILVDYPLPIINPTDILNNLKK